ncbi:GNAT family N-acetyltransferase [Chengkuizengella axinellae]|uniref:GNAT family N-acetyltransferase n=1 Tax=Chengkuizengella axinellae TaxID=3064388 RepID=A0ABT9IXW8_9BACL|nr:GNAT family N-acetyltransferase [Chengkuizengella sp. 2205SS18-9]MDP5274201.1 GNAT family N-acetyltransferase [Chengkuizengella sp. 2205SS18-9]
MIEGKNIILRTIREDDLDKIIQLTSDFSERGAFWHFRLPSQTAFYKRFNETGLWDDQYGTMLITDRNERLVGEITYFQGVSYLPGYEIGYQIYKKEDMGKGYTTEALRIFSSYLFELKPIERLEVVVNINNIGSRIVAEKCGYKFEGIKRNAVFQGGAYQDLELLSLLRGESPSLSEVMNL